MIRDITIAYPGTHKNTDLTRKDLEEVVETFNSSDVPVISPKLVITHNKVQEQQNLGKIHELYLTKDDALKAKFEFTDKKFEEKYEAGKYRRRSVGLRKALFKNKNFEGKKTYMHHLAFLDGTAPKIVGLDNYADNEEEFIEIEFSEKNKENDMDENKKVLELEKKIAVLEEKEKNFSDVSAKVDELEKALEEKNEELEKANEIIKDFSDKELERKKDDLRTKLEQKFSKKDVDEFFENKNFSDDDESDKWLKLISTLKTKPVAQKIDFSDVNRNAKANTKVRKKIKV